MNADRTGSLFLFLIGMYALVLSIQLPIGTLRQPGSGFFPLILACLLCFVAVSIFVSSKGGDKRGESRRSFWQRMKPWQIVVLTMGFIMAMKPLGYLVTSTLYLFCLLLLVCRLKIRAAVILALLLAPASWYFFGKVLSLHLPVGVWGY